MKLRDRVAGVRNNPPAEVPSVPVPNDKRFSSLASTPTNYDVTKQKRQSN